MLKQLQVHMDNLEFCMSLEGKEAFTKLQKEIHELTGELVGAEIPFLDYKVCNTEVPFPRTGDHSVSECSQACVKKGLKVINTNVLLLSFSHMLTYQQSFKLLHMQLWPYGFTHHNSAKVQAGV
jgi:hypothetical protein